MGYRQICEICLGWMVKHVTYYQCSTCRHGKINEGTLVSDKTKTFEEAEQRYGKIENKAWADESKWMVVMTLPEAISKVVANSANNKPCTKIYCNKEIVKPLTDIFNELISSKLEHELKVFDGCFMIRPVRGYTDKWSTHSYGLSIDWRAQEMPLNSKSLFSDAFVEVWKRHGFVWGGDFKRLDPQHFQWAAW